MITKQHYIAEIEFHLGNDAGDEVPYTICVTEYYHQEPDKNADSDIDYYGYTDIEYDVLDEHGKIVPVEEYRDCGDEIEQLITDHFEEEARESCYDCFEETKSKWVGLERQDVLELLADGFSTEKAFHQAVQLIEAVEERLKDKNT